MAQLVQNWSDVTFGALQNLWIQILGVLPLILGALIVFIIGLIVASFLELIVSRIIRVIKLDNLLIRSGVEEYFKRGGLGIDSGKFFGKLVYWFVVIAFALAASDILKFYAFSDFLARVLNYLPNIFIAVLILLATLIIANFLRTVIKASISSAKLQGVGLLSSLAWWAVVIFGLFASLVQLGIATSFFQILLSGLVAMIALAGGIAFGLGGKDYAAHLASKIREQLEFKK